MLTIKEVNQYTKIKGVDVYQIQSKSELVELLDKFKILRILGDRNIYFAWKADELDHSIVRKELGGYIENIIRFAGFMVEKIENDLVIAVPIGTSREIPELFRERFLQLS